MNASVMDDDDAKSRERTVNMLLRLLLVVVNIILTVFGFRVVNELVI